MNIDPQIEWLARLVAHDTTSSKSNLNLIEDVEGYLDSHNIEHHRVQNEDGTKSNLYALIGPRVAGGVVLSGHTDVVPVAGQDWDTDPFTIVEKDGLIYGRGTSDMKAFSALALSLIPEMLAADLKKPIILALSYDEEIGCLGAPDMIDEIAVHLPCPECVIVGEPTMMKAIDGHKGIASFRTTVTGFTTHSSQVERGVSAVMMAARLINFIEEMGATEKQRTQSNSNTLLERFDPPYSSMTVNVVSGGTQINIMAKECVFEWDMRCVAPSIGGADPQALFNKFDAFATSLKTEMQQINSECNIETIWLSNVPAFAPQLDNKAVSLVQHISGQNHTEAVAYAAEAGQFQNAGFDTVICGPGSIDQAHQPNEFISRDQLTQGYVFLTKLIERLS